jgi:stage V sporulation protein B
MAIMALAPRCCLLPDAAVRSYYQGLKNMIPTALSQVVEALVNLICGMLFAIGRSLHHGQYETNWVDLFQLGNR